MKKTFLVLLLGTMASVAFTQGPPITLDKPIMLGARKGTLRVYGKHVETGAFGFTVVMLEGDYNISNRLAVGADLPIVVNGSRLIGDASAMLKYQFLRRDGKGKTLRIAAKAKQGFATGIKAEVPVLGMGHNMTYAGILAAYESLHLGVQSEIGYAFMYDGTHLNNLGYKFGVGLPLLKPRYPVNQVTVYLESEGMNFPSHHDESQFGLFTAPGIQYARHRFTFDFSFQFPLAQNLQPSLQRKWTGLAGARLIL